MDYRRAKGNWSMVKEGGELACGIALINEAIPPPTDLGLYVETEEKTVGRDDVTHGGKKVRGWATAVVSPYPLVRPDDVWALSPNYKDRRPPVYPIGGTLAKCDPFGIPSTSHWTGAAIIVQSPRTKTCIVTLSRTSTRPMPFSLAG
jgi:hypothetical protein